MSGLTLRELSDDEMVLVAGGLSDTTIVVTGHPEPPDMAGDYFFNPWEPDGGWGGYNGSGETAGGGAYQSPGASAAANAFADSHVKQSGSSAADQAHYQQTHDDLAKVYDFAQSHGGTTVNIGNGHTATMAQVLDTLNKTTYVIGDAVTLAGDTGARTTVDLSGQTATIYINPSNDNTVAYDSQFAGKSGTDYEIFHELGHAIQYFNNNSAFGDEAAANTAGRSVELQLGITLLSDSSELVAPKYGYD